MDITTQVPSQDPSQVVQIPAHKMPLFLNIMGHAKEPAGGPLTRPSSFTCHRQMILPSLTFHITHVLSTLSYNHIPTLLLNLSPPTLFMYLNASPPQTSLVSLWHQVLKEVLPN